MNLDLITALLLGVAGFCAGMREIALSPENGTFPKAPWAVRSAIFLHAAAMAGGAMLFAASVSKPGDYAGNAAGPLAVFCFALALYHAVLFVNLFAQRYDRRIWDRLNRVTERVKATCPEPARGRGWYPF